MKKIILIILSLLLIISITACGGGETVDQGEGNVDETVVDTNNNSLGDYEVEIKSCRIAKDYDGNPVAIVKYNFKNNGEEAVSFDIALSTYAYQNGVELEHSFFLDDDANFDSDNMSKNIKSGANLDVEVAYELSDTTTDIEVEVMEWISFSNKKITKTFKISE